MANVRSGGAANSERGLWIAMEADSERQAIEPQMGRAGQPKAAAPLEAASTIV
jgi:hypothetical protein